MTPGNLYFRAKAIDGDDAGNRGGDRFPVVEREASVYDLELAQYQLSQICNDPNLTMVTSFVFDMNPALDPPERRAEWE